MRRVVLAAAAVLAVASSGSPQDLERWDLDAAQVTVKLRAGILRDLGVSVHPAARPGPDGLVPYRLPAPGRLVALAPGSIFRTVDLGELRLSGGPRLVWRRGRASLDGARLTPGREPRTFAIADASGQPLFLADHQHHAVDRRARRLRLFNLDLRLSAAAAAAIGEPRHEGLAVGVLEIEARAAIPRGSVERPDGACVTPDWGNPHNDVALIGIDQVDQVARDTGFVAVAPSATLKNVGATDVPWIAKFQPPAPPYNNDQHPYLVWNMYRIAGGRIEQIGASAAKHAFFTVNSNCTCAGGSILWVDCEDTYGVSTNDSSFSNGPRAEIDAHTGVWRRCGSIFDPDCDDVQDPVPPLNSASDPRRMAVRETDLQTPGAQYVVGAWYVVRDDVDIFNTMGWRRVAPAFAGGLWSFPFLSPLAPGGAVDAWVDPANPGPGAESVPVDTGAGKLTLAVRATGVGGGRWRYEYALMNHDFDARIGALTLPLPAGSSVTNVTFHDADANPRNDWQAVPIAGGGLRFEAPTSPLTPILLAQAWGTLYSFGLEVNSAPTGPQGTMVHLTSVDPADVVHVSVLGPTP